MRIECPACSAAYEVPDLLLTAGRVVRCTNCGAEWVPLSRLASTPTPAPLPVAEPLPSPEPAHPDTVTMTIESIRPSAMDRLAAHPAPAAASVQLLRLAWVASIAVLFLAAGAAYTWRDQIVEAWPESARAYAVFGLRAEQGR